MAIGIGAASLGRRWPLSHYAEALKRLTQIQDIWPVIVCSADEFGDALELHALLQQRASIVSGAPLREVCGVLERCELFIGNDSGCAHLAASMGCKVLVVSRHPVGGDPNHFNSPVRFAPWRTDAKVLQPATGRDDCKIACIEVKAHCILNVSVNEVFSEAKRVLDCRPAALTRSVEPWMPHALQSILSTPIASAAHPTARDSGIDGPSL